MTPFEKDLVELCQLLLSAMYESSLDISDYEIMLSMIRAKYNE